MVNFISPDSIVPNPANPQSLNRYAALANNPLKFSDPTGHMQTCEGCDGNGYNPVSLYHEWTLGYYDRGTLRVAFHHYYRANPARSLPSPRRDARGGTRNAYNDAAVDGKRDAEAEQGYLRAESVAHWDDRFARLSQDQGDIHRAQTSLVMAGQASRSVAAQFEYNTMALAECSFSAGTPVATEAGMLAISSVVTGTRMLGWDETTNTTGYYPVTHLWVHEDPVLVVLVVNGETITTTPEHPFYAPIRGWLPAGELLVGIGVRKADGGVGIVDAATTVTRTERMWNLTVDEAHTYFVGDEQVLFHNTGAGCPVFGTAQATKNPAHQFASNAKAQDMAQSGDYTQVHLDTSSIKIGNGLGVNVATNIMADVVGIRPDGSWHLVEYLSNGQSWKAMAAKLSGLVAELDL